MDEVKPQIIEKQVKIKDLQSGDKFKHYHNNVYGGTFYALNRERWGEGRPHLKSICNAGGIGSSPGGIYCFSEEIEVTLIEEIWEGLQKI